MKTKLWRATRDWFDSRTGTYYREGWDYRLPENWILPEETAGKPPRMVEIGIGELADAVVPPQTPGFVKDDDVPAHRRESARRQETTPEAKRDASVALADEPEPEPENEKADPEPEPEPEAAKNGTAASTQPRTPSKVTRPKPRPASSGAGRKRGGSGK